MSAATLEETTTISLTRVPVELKDWWEEASKGNRRSLSAEIVDAMDKIMVKATRIASKKTGRR